VRAHARPARGLGQRNAQKLGEGGDLGGGQLALVLVGQGQLVAGHAGHGGQHRPRQPPLGQPRVVPGLVEEQAPWTKANAGGGVGASLAWSPGSSRRETHMLLTAVTRFFDIAVVTLIFTALT
jgi:hypothetical protein